jgi:hypothetical protein
VGIQVGNRRNVLGKWANRLTLICISTLAGIIGPMIFLLVVFIIDFIQPGHNLIYETVSELVYGSYGWLQTISFLLFGTLLMIFAIRLYLVTSRSTISIVGAAFLGLSGFFFLILGAFPAQTSGVDTTFQQLMHNVAAGITGGSFIIGCFSFALYFKGDPRWGKYWVYTAITAIACLFFALLWAFTPLGLHAKGLDQLLMLLCGFLWLETISIRLLRLCLVKK